LLDDVEFITSTLLESAEKTKVTVVDYVSRKFEPQGVSVVVIISESHITIHTWPEFKYAALDFYTCGEEDPEPAVREIAQKFKTKELVLFRADRGNISKVRKLMKRKIRGDEQIRTDEMQVLL
jgi:S-adenosylmethionine decarboxylase